MFFLSPTCGHPNGFELMWKMEDQHEYVRAVKAMQGSASWRNRCGTCHHDRLALLWWPSGGYQN
jgi:hypothetical protein